jgi:hypothetical protein
MRRFRTFAASNWRGFPSRRDRPATSGSRSRTRGPAQRVADRMAELYGIAGPAGANIAALFRQWPHKLKEQLLLVPPRPTGVRFSLRSQTGVRITKGRSTQ